MEFITAGNMALHIDDQQNLYYHMDAYRSVMMEHSSFQSPEYLAVQEWITAMCIYPTNIHLASALPAP